MSTFLSALAEWVDDECATGADEEFYAAMVAGEGLWCHPWSLRWERVA